MAAPPPAAALELDELVEEILLRIPPDDPARLLAAALVCKRWCRLATSLGFRRRFRDLHRAPPLLGCLFNNYEQTGFRFVPTSSFHPPNAAADRRGLAAIHSRHGRVLLRHRGGAHARWAYPLIVWDPITDERQVLPIGPLCPHMAKMSWSAAVLCAAGDGCDHLDCQRGPFLVVFVAATYEKTYSCCVYSSKDDKWSKPVSIDAQGHHICPFDLGNVVLVGKALYFKFLLMSPVDMLKYDLVTGRMSLLCVPENHPLQHSPISALTVTDDGRLGCAFLSGVARLFLWSRKHLDGPDEEVTWEQSRVIELRGLLPIASLPMQPQVAGFADNGAGGVILIRTHAGFFTVDLRSGRVKKHAGESHECSFVVPYMSFCTPGTRERWCGPRAGWLKVNVDGAFDCETREGGIGVIIRDSAGTVLLSAWQYVPWGKDAEEIEALAARKGLLLAAEWLPSTVILEMDCNVVVCALQKKGRQSNLQFILEEAMKAAERLPEWTAVHTKRESNGAAHELAQLAKRTKHSATWHSATPVCIAQIIARECNQLFE